MTDNALQAALTIISSTTIDTQKAVGELDKRMAGIERHAERDRGMNASAVAQIAALAQKLENLDPDVLAALVEALIVRRWWRRALEFAVTTSKWLVIALPGVIAAWVVFLHDLF